jgi:phospholipid transport system substrate-binding protein
MFSDVSPAVASVQALVKDISSGVVDAARLAGLASSGDRRAFAGLVRARLLPHLDAMRMTRLAAGRHWSQATPPQQQQLVEGSTTYLVEMYAHALWPYLDGKIVLGPARVAADGEAWMTLRLASGTGPGEPLGYHLQRDAGGAWKIDEIDVSSVALVVCLRDNALCWLGRSGADAALAALNKLNGRFAAYPADEGSRP